MLLPTATLLAIVALLPCAYADPGPWYWNIDYFDTSDCSGVSTVFFGDETATGYDCVNIADGNVVLRSASAPYTNGAYTINVFEGKDCSGNQCVLFGDLCCESQSTDGIKSYRIIWDDSSSDSGKV